MNRREALKKLGAGGAIVVGASAVRSVPAFAVGAPVISVSNVGIAQVLTTQLTLSWTIGVQCPASSTECIDVECQPSPDFVEVEMIDDAAGGTGANTPAGAYRLKVGTSYFGVGAPVTLSAVSVYGVEVRRRSTATPTTSQSFQANDEFQVQLTVQATCTGTAPGEFNQDTQFYAWDLLYDGTSWSASAV